jgi:hypothetical protein
MGEETLLVRSKDKNFQKANPCLANHSKRRPQVCGVPEAVPSSGVPTSPPEKSVLPETDRTRSPDLRDLWGKLDPGDALLLRPASCRLPDAAAIAVNLSQSYFSCPSNRLKNKCMVRDRGTGLEWRTLFGAFLWHQSRSEFRVWLDLARISTSISPLAPCAAPVACSNWSAFLRRFWRS